MDGQQTYRSASVTPDQRLIDSIVYLASLVSNQQAVDTKLDTLRLITARAYSGQQLILNNEDRSALAVLEGDLKNYLTTSDPIRSFSPDKLQARLDKHLQTQDPQAQVRRSTLRQLLAIFGLSFAAYGIAVLFAPGQFMTKFQLASPFFLVFLHAGLAWLFWSGRREFVAALRVCYGYICAGLIISSLGSMQFPVLFAYPALTHLPIFRYAGFMPPFQLMCTFFYIGLYIYAKQIPEIRLRFLKPAWIVSGAAIVSLAVIFMPQVVHVQEKLFFDMSLISTVLSVFFSIPAAILGFTIVRHLTPRYTQAMRLFAGAQVAVAAACVLFSVVLYIKGPISGATVAVSALPFGVSETLMLISAYKFKKSVSD